MCVATTLLFGCGQEAPKCSDVATLSTVKKIIVGMLPDGSPAALFTDQERNEALSIENPRASGFEEKIKKYTCEAKLVIPFKVSELVYSSNITYESQLDDKDSHLVVVKGFTNADVRAITLGFMSEGLAVQKAKEKAQQEIVIVQPPPPVVVSQPPAGVTADSIEKEGICKGLDTSVNVDMTECTSRKFAVVDKELNETYKQLMSRLDEPAKASLRSSQRAWIREKEEKCAAEGKEFEGGSMRPIVEIACEAKMTEKQLSVLKSMK
jgi:uncharacterized protein YecT (DUF1311 family)